MIEIANYVKAESLEEAWELNQKKGNVILGGMLWLKLQNRRVNTAIDLSGLSLDGIEETPQFYRIGAMVTLRQLERQEELNRLTDGALRECVKDIVGVQFRNLATVGGSLFGRFGFSDVLTFFMAAGGMVELYRGGAVTVEEFSRMPCDGDILTHVILPRKKQDLAYLAFRNTRTDFPALNCCVSRDGEEIRCCIGARPMRAVCVRDEKEILKDGITGKSAQSFGEYVKENVKTGSNTRASGEYRSVLAQALTKRALLSIADKNR